MANIAQYCTKIHEIQEGRKIFNGSDNFINNKIRYPCICQYVFEASRNEVASSRYFVPSGTRRRGRDALRRSAVGTGVSTATTKGGGGSELEVASDLDSRAVRSAFDSAACLHCISLSPFPSFSLPLFLALHREHAHMSEDMRASAR